ncbi:hypothetical protein AB0I49_37150 [Streptomyces sp. NPDC050617]|uniref:pPIWI_RE_Y domain-containing protein n=1 Tax=Streptomyces sp. NPDC050617 TaxID=3154628 RepID=UPI003415AD43
MSSERKFPPACWAEAEGILLLRSIATGMVRLSQVANTGATTLPYPDEAQRALNSTILTCLLLKAEPPTSLLKLVEWAAHRPVDRWPAALPPDAVPPGSLLLDKATRQPTQLCYEWAVDAEDSASLYSEQRYMTIAAQRCQEEVHPEAYHAFRRLLVRRPVLTHRELTTLPAAGNGELEALGDLLRDIYQPTPASYLDQEQRTYTACARCHTLLHPTTEGGLWCERQRCRDMGTVRRGREYRADHGGGIHLLIRPLRQWVSEPGTWEIRMARRLTNNGADVELWPGFGNYGMRVRLPDGTALAVDCKDWASPALLGRQAKPPPPDPPYDRCTWVVPSARLRDRPGFRATFERYRSSSSPDLITDRELVGTVRQLVGPVALRNRHTGMALDRGDEPREGLF